VHDKFTTLGMHALHVIPEDITKWYIQLIHILAAIAFFIPAKFKISDLFLHVLGPNFGYFTPITSLRSIKIPIIFVLP
jgi:hypothetical protein